MSIDEYYVLIISVLMGLTFIALILIFLYMIYGEKEESVTSSNAVFLKKILRPLILWLFEPLAIF
jgi:hypothetical protein